MNTPSARATKQGRSPAPNNGAHSRFLYVEGRLSRFSKIGGEMAPHVKVEQELTTLLGSGRCLVTGVPDERRGERLAVLYVDEQITPAEMIGHLESRGLPALWIPKRNQFHSVERIPVLGTGKADLASARAIARTQQAACR